MSSQSVWQSLCSTLGPALSFLSRLAPARIYSAQEMERSVAFYPLAGLLLGLAAALPFWLLGGTGWQGQPGLKAWLYMLWLLFLTRALHWDGWADLLDAMGSGQRGAGFTAVLKDSRLGMFGALGLCMGLLGHWLLLTECLRAEAWAALVWSVAAGRCCVTPLAFWAAGLPKPTAANIPASGLGRLVLAGATRRTALGAILFALASGIIAAGLKETLVFSGLSAAGLYFLVHSSRRGEGLNGDFFGAAVIWGEMAALVSVVIFI